MKQISTYVRWQFVLASLGCCGVTMALASEPETPNALWQLDSLVISGSRTETPLADTPVRTQLLDAATIKRLHTRDVRDALRVLPGVQLREIHGKTGQEVYLQGFNGDRVLILVDGLPISATTGSTVDLTQLSTLDIERIEVVPGAASALYGSAAMGGVINIITRQPEAGQGHTKLSLDAGSFGSKRELSGATLPQQHGRLQLQQPWGERLLQASVDWRRSRDFDLNLDSWTSNHFDGDKVNWQLGLLQPAPAAHHWRLNLDHYNEDLSRRQWLTNNRPGTHSETLRRQRISWQGGFEAGLNWDYAVLHEVQQDDTEQVALDPEVRAGSLWRSTDYDQQKFSWQGSWRSPESDITADVTWDSHLVFGVEWFQEGLQQDKKETKLTAEGVGSNSRVLSESDGVYLIGTNEVPYERRHSTEVFAQWGWLQNRDPAQRLTQVEWSPGVRWQMDSDFGAYSVPSLAARQRWQVSETWWLQSRQSVGIGYRVPNLKNRYYLFDHSVNGYKVLGNPDLTPERSKSVQLSLLLTNEQSWHLEWSAFWNDIDDLIEAEATGETEEGGRVAIYRYRNLARAQTRGYEWSLQHALSQQWQQRFSYGFLDARDLDTELPLLNRARHTVKGMWTWLPSERWEWSLLGEYQNTVYTRGGDTRADFYQTPNWVRWDIKGSFQWKPNMQFYGGINNFTDAVRDANQPYDRRPTEGRFPYLGVTLSL